jgi:hypothetical protein
MMTTIASSFSRMGGRLKKILPRLKKSEDFERYA